MKKASGGEGGKPATRFGFGFSWADEVEREERELQQLPVEEQITVQRPEQKKEQTTRADPFGAARPREVVLAEKGVDWRACDRELDAPMRVAVPPASARRSTTARRAPRDRGSGRTPGPRLHNAESTPQAKDAPHVSRSAWGGGKRKCAGEVPAPATARRAGAVGDQGRKVFSELNVSEGCAASFRSAAKKGSNSGGSETDGGGSRGCSEMATAVTATEDQSAVGQKRRKGRKRGRGGGSKKTENQPALLL